MNAGYCRHHWTDCSATLSETFPTRLGEERRFRVCSRCLRIEEAGVRQVAVEFSRPEVQLETVESLDDRAA